MKVTCPICEGTNVELLEEILRGSTFFEKYICKDCKQLDKELNVERYYSIWEIPEK
mgnify:FL=1